MRSLGIERVTGNVLAHFEIQEQGTKRFVKKHVSAILHAASTRESGLLAHARPAFTVGFPIIHTRSATKWIVDAPAPDGQLDSIGVGDHTVSATIICREQTCKTARNFKVGSAQHLTFWV